MNIQLIRPDRHRGSVLLFSVIILSVITFGAVLAMKQSTLQVRMTNNMQFHMDAFYSAMDSLVVLEKNLATGANTGLGDLIELENADDTDLGVVSVDLYDIEGWDTPTPSNSKVISSVTNEVSIGSLPDEDEEYNLKSTPGSSVKAVGMYTFIVRSTATDKSGNITSSQELAIRRPGPSG